MSYPCLKEYKHKDNCAIGRNGKTQKFVAELGNHPGMSEIKDRVRERRRELGLTQKDLAGKCGPGVKQQNVQQVESGVVRSPSYILELARALKVDPGWLRRGTGFKEPAEGLELEQPNTALPEGTVVRESRPSYEENPARFIEKTKAESQQEELFDTSKARLEHLAGMVQNCPESVRPGLIDMIASYLQKPSENVRQLETARSILTLWNSESEDR